MTRKIEQELDCVGIKFRWNKERRAQLHDVLPIRGLLLAREQENKYDINAIRVELPNLMFGNTTTHLGYVRRDTAALIALRMDEGTLEVESASLVGLYEPDWKDGVMEVVFRDLS